MQPEELRLYKGAPKQSFTSVQDGLSKAGVWRLAVSLCRYDVWLTEEGAPPVEDGMASGPVVEAEF